MYDALYGTDVIGEDNGAERVGKYNPVRGDKVIKYARELLDEVIPLAQGSHTNSVGYAIGDDNQLIVTLEEGTVSSLANPEKLIGFQGERQNPSAVLSC